MTMLREAILEELERVKDLHKIECVSVFSELVDEEQAVFLAEGFKPNAKRTDGENIYIRIEATNCFEDEIEVSSEMKKENGEEWEWLA